MCGGSLSGKVPWRGQVKEQRRFGDGRESLLGELVGATMGDVGSSPTNRVQHSSDFIAKPKEPVSDE